MSFQMVAIIIALSSIGAFSTLYILRKLREWQWGWVNNKYCLRNRIFIITGANSGLGYETTKALVERNATVIMACRDIQKTNKAISEIRRKIYNGKLVSCPPKLFVTKLTLVLQIAMNLDLSSFNSIRSFANEINNKYPEFYALIQNAGVATNKANQTTLDGHEVHVGTNYLGHFFLTLLLKETIHINQSRIVIVSSHLHESAKLTFIAPEEMNYKKNSVNPMYKTSKLMNFYFARHLYVQNFDVHILCPGLCYTSLFRDYELNWYQLIILLPIMCFILRSAKQVISY